MHILTTFPEQESRVDFKGHEAVNLGTFDPKIQEMMCYLYLPIKMIDSNLFDYEERLYPLTPMINRAVDDYEDMNGEGSLFGRYVYVTAKRLFVTPDNIGNRPGWHCDGWETNDINYIWCDVNSTVFNRSRFIVQRDDVLALDDLEKQAMPSNNYVMPVKSLIRIDSLTPHRTPTITESGYRTFIKISISMHRYNLSGNSHNYKFNYDWTLHDRRKIRNMENSDFVK